MSLKSFHKQVRTVIAIEIVLISCGVFISKLFWDHTCNTNITTCLSDANLSITTFLILNVFRPLLLTPLPVFSLMAGHAFGPGIGALVSACGACISCAVVYSLAKAIGKKLVNPWLSSNLPQTLRFIRSQDWKIVLICRFIPLFPFDFLTLIFGLLDFRWKHVMLATFLGVLPEAYVFSEMADPNSTIMRSVLTSFLSVFIFIGLPALFFEFSSRRKGSSLLVRLKAMWVELNEEIRYNNNIVKRDARDPKKIPVLLVYGYFSSRRVLTVLERILSRHGYEVISFNLGGLFGTFFTRGIKETAEFIDYKLKRQFQRYDFDQVKIVAHSKGGLVALWWVLKLGGSKHCSKIVTMGSPFKGSMLTWIALVTPIGLIFRDLWQMRPNSDFLRELGEAPIPDHVTVYNLYSNRDTVAKGESGIYKQGQNHKQIVVVPMHHVSHYEFLYRRDVGDALVEVLGSPFFENPADADAPAS